MRPPRGHHSHRCFSHLDRLATSKFISLRLPWTHLALAGCLRSAELAPAPVAQLLEKKPDSKTRASPLPTGGLSRLSAFFSASPMDSTLCPVGAELIFSSSPWAWGTDLGGGGRALVQHCAPRAPGPSAPSKASEKRRISRRPNRRSPLSLDTASRHGS